MGDSWPEKAATACLPPPREQPSFWQLAGVELVRRSALCFSNRGHHGARCGPAIQGFYIFTFACSDALSSQGHNAIPAKSLLMSHHQHWAMVMTVLFKRRRAQ